jgi:hypothetical protein
MQIEYMSTSPIIRKYFLMKDYSATSMDIKPELNILLLLHQFTEFIMPQMYTSSLSIKRRINNITIVTEIPFGNGPDANLTRQFLVQSIKCPSDDIIRITIQNE